ncbi:MAG TPA: RDD family protein [Solirubrobacteraceae bacterium]|nr:RDD family protein [Solirubrobacteraceae bacterium]
MRPSGLSLDDRVAIATPEGVALELTLAGLGSRAIAGGTDLVIKGLLILLLIIALSALDVLVVALVIPLIGLVLLCYDIAFETLAQGRTPGKRMSGLRVVRDSGGPVDLPSSAVRNVLRLVDGLPLSYVPTNFGVLLTRRNQRPGDLVAGTLVIRERMAGAGSATVAAPAYAPPVTPDMGSWDVSALDGEQLAMVRSFLARREGLEAAARVRLAQRLADAMRPRVGGADEPDDERFLERLEREKAARGG